MLVDSKIIHSGGFTAKSGEVRDRKERISRRPGTNAGSANSLGRTRKGNLTTKAPSGTELSSNPKLKTRSSVRKDNVNLVDSSSEVTSTSLRVREVTRPLKTNPQPPICDWQSSSILPVFHLSNIRKAPSGSVTITVSPLLQRRIDRLIHKVDTFRTDSAGDYRVFQSGGIPCGNCDRSHGP